MVGIHDEDIRITVIIVIPKRDATPDVFFRKITSCRVRDFCVCPVSVVAPLLCCRAAILMMEKTLTEGA